MNKNLNKNQILAEILGALDKALKVALDAAQQARDTATHAENVAENRHDTLGLEAAYLAHGQSNRVATCEADLHAFNLLQTTMQATVEIITVGSYIVLADDSGCDQHLFLGPAAGGLKVTCGKIDIVVISPSAPLGRALLGCVLYDEITLNIANEKKHYEIRELW